MAETTEKEKMRALQKAYAETILNTAKEAAARIMSSERKAQQYHRDLCSTKDEALRLLLRLKHSFHAQMNEAEMKSLNQQRRIDELEAQLQEAEDIVSNLRAELNDAHMKLEEMENNQINHGLNISEKVHSDNGAKQRDNGLLQGDLAGKTNLINNFDDEHYAADNSLGENGHSGDPVVPSIIMRSKKPELYRNGCTQRIRAYERNLVNGHFPLSGELDYQRDLKAIREDKEGEDKQDLEMKSISPVYPVLERKKRKNKRKAARHVTHKPIQFLANSQTCLPSSHDMYEGSDNKVQGTHVHSPSTVPPNASEMDVLSGHLVSSQGAEAETCMVASENTKTANTLVLIGKPSDSEDCLDDSNLKQDLELEDSSSVNLDSKQLKAGDGFASPPPKDRFLKYTFQRKRKRESLSGDGKIMQQENPLNRRILKKQIDNLEGPESSAVADLSRDSRRMAQVARQLISLSEKKWWNCGSR